MHESRRRAGLHVERAAAVQGTGAGAWSDAAADACIPWTSPGGAAAALRSPGRRPPRARELPPAPGRPAPSSARPRGLPCRLMTVDRGLGAVSGSCRAVESFGKGQCRCEACSQCLCSCKFVNSLRLRLSAKASEIPSKQANFPLRHLSPKHPTPTPQHSQHQHKVGNALSCAAAPAPRAWRTALAARRPPPNRRPCTDAAERCQPLVACPPALLSLCRCRPHPPSCWTCPRTCCCASRRACPCGTASSSPSSAHSCATCWRSPPGSGATCTSACARRRSATALPGASVRLTRRLCPRCAPAGGSPLPTRPPPLCVCGAGGRPSAARQSSSWC